MSEFKPPFRCNIDGTKIKPSQNMKEHPYYKTMNTLINGVHPKVDTLVVHRITDMHSFEPKVMLPFPT